MPWTPSSGPARHTKKAKTPKAKKQWSAVANSMLEGGASEGTAIKAANGVIKKRSKKNA